jgi:hypothetical protein
MEAGPIGDRPRGWGRSSEMDWIDGITDRLSHLGDNSARTMFGGHSLYWRGVIFAIAHRKRLYLKVEDQSKPAFEDPGMGPLRPNVAGNGEVRGAGDASVSIRWRPRMTQPKNSDTSAKRKISEMISEMAAGFLGVGDTIEERQNRLNAACTAWNLACGSPEVRQQQLEQYREGYLRLNPGTSPTDLANIIKDLESLIERKLKMFPDDHRQVVSARVVMVGNAYRIEVASATLP